MNRLRIVFRSTVLLAGLCFASANAQSPSPTLVCGLEVYASPIGFPEAESSADVPPDPGLTPSLSGDPCQEGTTVFSAQYERGTGKPVQVISEFILDADADVCIISESAAKGKASLFLDGLNIAEPEDFDDQIDIHTDSLVAGSHGLGVRAVGKPGGFVNVEVRQLESGGGGGDPDLPAPGEIQIDTATGAVDMVSADGRVRLQNVATDHPLLTPNGDGHHDTTVFQSLTTPLVDLPGKDDGTVEYFLDWEFQIVDLATCNTIDTGLTGSTQINSPTLAEIEWDGTDITGTLLPPGNYAYVYDVNVVDEFEVNFGSITAPGFGIVIAGPSPTDYNERAEFSGCDAATDPYACKCPGVNGAPGTPDSNCAFAFPRDLLPEWPGPELAQPNYYQYPSPSGGNIYYDPSAFLDLDEFILTTLDPITNRYTVTVDLRDYNAKGLVPKGSGVWDNEAHLRRWVWQMTGVPLSTDDSLFNFDFVQIGTSSAAGVFGPSNHSYNHFFLDAITDGGGRITVGGLTIDPSNGVNDDVEAPAQYSITGRAGDECNNNANLDGTNTLRAKFCAYNTAVKFGNVTDLGVYTLRTTVFDVNFNNDLTQQDIHCVFDPLFHCGVRTNAVLAYALEIESSYYDYVEGSEPVFIRTEDAQVDNATGASMSIDRANGPDGVCSRAVAIRDGLAVRMDAADGAVPDSCIINGIF